MLANQGQAPAGVVCDKGCKKRFELPHKPEQLCSKNAGTYQGQEVTVYYFTCPHCGAEYITHCETVETQRLTAKYKKLQEKRMAKLATLGDPKAPRLNPKQTAKVKEAEQLIKREKKLMRQMRELQMKMKTYMEIG